MSSAPRITVAVPAYCTQRRHGSSRLRLTLASLARQTIPPDQYEIVVVDDGSDPPLAGLVDDWGLADRVRVLRRERIGLAHAYNEAMDAARGELFLFGTDDELAAPDLLAQHVKRHDEPGLMVFGRCLTCFHTELFADVSTGEVVPGALTQVAANPETTWLPGAVGALGLDTKPITLSDVTDNFEKILAVSGQLPQFADIERAVATGRCHEMAGGWLAVRVGNHSVATETLRAVGGFDPVLDEHHGWYLDVELGIRLIDHGVRFVLEKAAVSTNLAHPRAVGRTLGAISGMAYLFGKHRRMDVALSPLYFQRGLGVAEYDRLLRGARKWWPDDLV